MVLLQQDAPDAKPEGDAIAADKKQAIPPPDEIGRILSCHSTENLGSDWYFMVPRFLMLSTATALTLWLAHWLVREFEIFALTIPVMISSGLGLLLVVLSQCVGARYFVHFVGEHGVARYTLNAQGTPIAENIMLFYKAEYLERHYESTLEPAKFIYQSVDEEECLFVWKDGVFNSLFEITGINSHQDQASIMQSHYLFGCAAEKAWSHHLARCAGTFIQSERSVFFPLAHEIGWLSFEGDNLRYNINDDNGVYPVKNITSLNRSHRYLVMEFAAPQGGGFEELHISLTGFPNNRFFFSLLELYTGVKVAVNRPLPEKKKLRLDPILHIPDHVLFNERLSIAISHSQQNRTKLLLVVLEVNNLVFINHSHGRSVGSRLLAEIGQRLKSAMDSDEYGTARMEGVEFAAIQSDFPTEEEAPTFLGRIWEQINQPMSIASRRIAPEIHMGHAFFPDDGSNAASLLRTARVRMYANKYRAMLKSGSK